MSYRPSTSHPSEPVDSAAYSVSSYPSQSTAMTASHLRLLDKQRELQAFMAVEVEGARLRAYLDGFGDKMNILEEGTEAVSKVVEHWQNVFRATQLALASLNQQKEAFASSTTEVVDRLPEGTLPERLLRIPTEYSKSLETSE